MVLHGTGAQAGDLAQHRAAHVHGGQADQFVLVPGVILVDRDDGLGVDEQARAAQRLGPGAVRDLLEPEQPGLLVQPGRAQRQRLGHS